jgi:phenylpyruvate tautomerase PptA (4-oxalocrotonate tautomerase family)
MPIIPVGGSQARVLAKKKKKKVKKITSLIVVKHWKLWNREEMHL